MASSLLSQKGMRISLTFPDVDPELELAGGALSLIEVLEGDREFLDALAMRLDEIVGKPKGRFVISYRPGQAGARPTPRVR